MNQLSLIIHEIALLGPARLQGVFSLAHALVLELYTHEHGRLYLVADYGPEHPSFHLQKTKAQGQKFIKPLSLILKKYALGRGIIFRRIEHQPFTLRADILAADQDFCLMFELEKPFKIGFFNKNHLMASAFKSFNPPSFSNFIILSEGRSSLEHNLAQAERYARLCSESVSSRQLCLHSKALGKQLKKKIALLKNLHADYQKCESSLALESEAELIKANIRHIRRGMTQISVFDYTTQIPEQKIISLDPKLNPKQYLQKLFHQVKRARRGIALIQPKILKVKSDIDALKLALENPSLNLIEPEHEKQDQSKTQKQIPKKGKRLPYRIFESSDGIPIWVGRSAKDNDALTLHHARGNEWWFHVREGAGSHVVVKDSKDVIPTKTMLEAAMLAAYFSKQKNNPSTEVCYTRIKYIKKPKNSTPGKVLIEQEKSLFIKINYSLIDAMIK